jgi:hypothetical protein
MTCPRLWLVLLAASVGLVDLITSEDPVRDCPIYAWSKVLSGHAVTL